MRYIPALVAVLACVYLHRGKAQDSTAGLFHKNRFVQRAHYIYLIVDGGFISRRAGAGFAVWEGRLPPRVSYCWEVGIMGGEFAKPISDVGSIERKFAGLDTRLNIVIKDGRMLTWIAAPAFTVNYFWQYHNKWEDYVYLDSIVSYTVRREWKGIEIGSTVHLGIGVDLGKVLLVVEYIYAGVKVQIIEFERKEIEKYLPLQNTFMKELKETDRPAFSIIPALGGLTLAVWF